MRSSIKQIIADPSPIPRIRNALVKSTKRIGTWRAVFFLRLVSKHSSALGVTLLTQKRASPLSHKSMNLREQKVTTSTIKPHKTDSLKLQIDLFKGCTNLFTLCSGLVRVDPLFLEAMKNIPVALARVSRT